MGLTGAQRQPYRQTIAIDHRMNFARQAAAGPSHRLALVSCDAGSMLMHADNGGVDHLDSGIMGSGKCVHDAAPDTSPPPADETVIAGRVRAKMIRQIAPGCPRSQDPENTVKDTSVVYPRNATRLVRQHGLDGDPFIISEFVAHDSSPQFGSLNHRGLANGNASGSAPVRRLRAEADINLPTIPDQTVENAPFATCPNVDMAA